MALNMENKMSSHIKDILPEIDFLISASGITVISSERLATPRYIPYDNPGKCKECKASELDIDFAVVKEGVTVYCSRFKGHRFVPFDIIHDLPEHCFFKVSDLMDCKIY
jgi:hypothetical protein